MGGPNENAQVVPPINPRTPGVPSMLPQHDCEVGCLPLGALIVGDSVGVCQLKQRWWLRLRTNSQPSVAGVAQRAESAVWALLPVNVYFGTSETAAFHVGALAVVAVGRLVVAYPVRCVAIDTSQSPLVQQDIIAGTDQVTGAAEEGILVGKTLESAALLVDHPLELLVCVDQTAGLRLVFLRAFLVLSERPKLFREVDVGGLSSSQIVPLLLELLMLLLDLCLRNLELPPQSCQLFIFVALTIVAVGL